MIDIAAPHDDGSFISERVSRTVELIRERYPQLDVVWIPPAKRAVGDAAFAITERLPTGQVVVAFHVQTEDEMNESVLGQIYLADTTKHDVQTRLEANQQAARDLKRKEYEETMAESADIAISILKSGRARYRHNGRVYE